MTHCYFDGDSYYIIGTNIEVFSVLKNQETDPIKRAYWAFIMLIPELEGEKDNVTFYNDSRVIDEMNGSVHPLDDWTREAKRIANQMLASLYSIALFRKLDNSKLLKKIEIGRGSLTKPHAKQDALTEFEKNWNEKHSLRIKKLKKSFFGEKDGN